MRKFGKNRADRDLSFDPVPRLAANGDFRPLRSILLMAWPVVLEMGLHTFVWIFDTAMVMRLGAREASGVEYGASE